MTEAVNKSLLGLTALVQLERRARHAKTVQDLAFLIVNDSHGLVRYRQAALWRSDGGGRGRLIALSGLAQVNRDAPFVTWLERLFRAIDKTGDRGPRVLTAAVAPEPVRPDWATWLPVHALWLPLGRPDGGVPAALLVARDEPWSEAERHLLTYLTDSFGHAWGALEGRGSRWRGPSGTRRWLGWAAALILGGAGFLPVHQSVLAPAEVIAARPAVVRAPLDGVVDKFFVAPNDEVAEGQPLLALDPVRLQNRLDVALKARDVAEAEYRQAAQQALSDPRSKAQLAVLKGRLEQQAAEVAYLEELKTRIEIKAPRPGLALFEDVSDWIGRPVTLGERILMVADPAAMELEIRLPVADAIVLQPGAETLFFLNVDPQNPVPARLTTASYQASAGPDQVLAYRLKAAFDQTGADRPPSLRIGLKGTAKLYGAETTLFYYVMRRPLAAARQWLGL